MILTKTIGCSIAFFLILIGCFSIYQRETLIVRNHEILAAVATQHGQALGQITQFLNQQIQKTQEKPE